jgi:hypothetical protein
MKINIEEGKLEEKQKRMIIKPEAILRYLITEDDKMDTLIMCKGEQLNLITTDYSLYEAMGSVMQYDNFKLNKLVKFFQVVDIQSCGRKKEILKEERVEELRKLALKENYESKEKNDGGDIK